MLFNEEIEQSFIGALLVNDVIYDDVSYVRPAHFYFEPHARIYEHIKRLKNEGKTVTPQFIAQYFANDNSLPANYVTDLAGNLVSTYGAKAHAAQIYAMHLRRGLKALSLSLNTLADNPDIDQSPKDLLAQAEEFITEATDTDNADTLRHVGEKIEEALAASRNPQMGIRSGLDTLDGILRGYHAGRLYVLAARPAMGKTAMGVTHAINAAKEGVKTLFFSLEMTHQEIQGRLIQRFGNSEELQNAQLYIDDKSGLTAPEIAQRARRHKRRHGLDIIFIDYLGLIRAVDKRAQMVHQIAEITGALKALAKDLRVPVVLLCQLSRGVEGRDNKRPTMADLRDSGAIEQDADVVMFIYREEYYLAQNQSSSSSKKYKGGDDVDHLAALQNAKGKAELIVAKNRQGRLGTANINFDAEGQVFFD